LMMEGGLGVNRMTGTKPGSNHLCTDRRHPGAATLSMVNDRKRTSSAIKSGKLYNRYSYFRK
ncbi:MAG TPA: hypothetical protein VLM40_03770, partial [Gemmata sp.]|nr:hypothetical protein [Gemmata sp.]